MLMNRLVNIEDSVQSVNLHKKTILLTYYHPVIVLSHASKIFEKIVVKQMNLFFESKFLSLLTAFRKNHSKQIALNMTEK